MGFRLFIENVEERVLRPEATRRRKIMRKRLKTIIIFWGLSLLTGFGLVFAQSSTTDWEKTLAIDPSQPLNFTFHDIDGDLKVMTSEQPTVTIKTHLQALTKDAKLAERLLKATKVQVNQQGNDIQVEIIYPRLRAIFFPWRDYRRIKASTEVSLPVNANLQARLVDGQARVEGKFKEINLAAVDGSLWLENVAGQLRLRTVDGRIAVKQGRGEVQANSVDGHIVIQGGFEPVEVTTTDGDIDIELDPDTSISQAWRLSTVDGHIEISLPKNISADLKVETSDGSIRCDLALAFTESLRGKQISGRINEGGPLISLRSVDGRIWLRSK